MKKPKLSNRAALWGFLALALATQLTTPSVFAAARKSKTEKPAAEATATLATDQVALSADEIAKRVDFLLTFKDRPTLSDIFKVFGGRPASNPFLMHRNLRAQVNAQVLQQVNQVIPSQLAGIELAFPGARVAPLGRDAAPYGDILDAFYLSIGQSGRLARLNGSGGTVRSAGPAGLVKMLESAGFSIEKGPQQRPFLIMDCTSYASGGKASQTGYIMEAAYGAYQKLGNDTADLVHTLNVIALHSNGIELSAPGVDVDGYFKRAVASARQNDARWPYMPNEIFGFAQTNGFTYHGEWHNGYGNAQLQANGKYEGTPGQVASEAVRLGILAEMYAVFEEVSKPSFLAQVQLAAKKFGYDFPLKGEFEPLKIVKLDPKARYEALEEDLKTLIGGMEKGEDVEKKYFSPNGKLLADWIELNKGTPGGYIDSNQVALMSIWNITQARGERKIGKKDYRRLLAKTFEILDVSDPQTIKHFKAMIEEHPRLESILSTRAWSFSAKATHNYEVVSEKFEVIKEKILIPMKCDLVLTPPDSSVKATAEKEAKN